MRYFSLVILFISMFFAASAYPANHSFPCGTVKQIFIGNMKDGYTYFAVGKENNGIVIALFINQRNGDFRVVGMDKDLHACNMLAGTEFEFLKISSM